MVPTGLGIFPNSEAWMSIREVFLPPLLSLSWSKLKTLSPRNLQRYGSILEQILLLLCVLWDMPLRRKRMTILWQVVISFRHFLLLFLTHFLWQNPKGWKLKLQPCNPSILMVLEALTSTLTSTVLCVMANARQCGQKQLANRPTALSVMPRLQRWQNASWKNSRHTPRKDCVLGFQIVIWSSGSCIGSWKVVSIGILRGGARVRMMALTSLPKIEKQNTRSAYILACLLPSSSYPFLLFSFNSHLHTNWANILYCPFFVLLVKHLFYWLLIGLVLNLVSYHVLYLVSNCLV